MVRIQAERQSKNHTQESGHILTEISSWGDNIHIHMAKFENIDIQIMKNVIVYVP